MKLLLALILFLIACLLTAYRKYEQNKKIKKIQEKINLELYGKEEASEGKKTSKEKGNN